MFSLLPFSISTAFPNTDVNNGKKTGLLMPCEVNSIDLAVGDKVVYAILSAQPQQEIYSHQLWRPFIVDLWYRCVCMDRGAGHRYQIMRTSVDKRVLHRIIKLKDLMGTTTFFFFSFIKGLWAVSLFLWQINVTFWYPPCRLCKFNKCILLYVCLDSIIILFLVQCF